MGCNIIAAYLQITHEKSDIQPLFRPVCMLPYVHVLLLLLNALGLGKS